VPDRTTLRWVVVPDLEGDESGVLDLFLERGVGRRSGSRPGRGPITCRRLLSGGSSGVHRWPRAEIGSGGRHSGGPPPLVVLVPTCASGPRQCACHASGRPCGERVTPFGRSRLGRAEPWWSDDRASWSLPFRAGRQPSQSDGPPCWSRPCLHHGKGDLCGWRRPPPHLSPWGLFSLHSKVGQCSWRQAGHPQASCGYQPFRSPMPGLHGSGRSHRGSRSPTSSVGIAHRLIRRPGATVCPGVGGHEFLPVGGQGVPRWRS
jgi:hypothetical protein